MKNKPLVTSVSTKNESDKEAVMLGKAILNNKQNAIVFYRRKKWNLVELLQHLARHAQKLERNQCKPSAKCLFEGQKYMDIKYLGKKE